MSSAAEQRRESPGRAVGREARVLLRGRRGAAVPGVLPGSSQDASAPARGGRGLRRRRLPGCPTRLRGAGGGAAPGPGRRSQCGRGNAPHSLRRAGRQNRGPRAPGGEAWALPVCGIPAYLPARGRCRGCRSRRARSSPASRRTRRVAPATCHTLCLASGSVRRIHPHTHPRPHPVLLLFRTEDAKYFALGDCLHSQFHGKVTKRRVSLLVLEKEKISTSFVLKAGLPLLKQEMRFGQSAMSCWLKSWSSLHLPPFSLLFFY